MQLKALIATLVLGSSSVALAGPQIRDHRTTVTVTPVQARFDAHLDARVQAARFMRPLPPVHTSRITLADNLALQGRSVLSFSDYKAHRYTKLEVSAQGRGKVDVDKIVIHFGNGTSQTVKLDTKLSATDRALSIDLDASNARFIKSIEVVGASKSRRATLDIVAL